MSCVKKIPSKPNKIRKRKKSKKSKDIAKKYKTNTIKGKPQLEENNNVNGNTETTCTTDIKPSFLLISLLDLVYKFYVS